MTYALDVNNPRIKQAMENLGIEKEELLIKSLNSFESKGVRDEIKQLRFEYYSKRLEETVKIIKDSARSYPVKIKDDNTKRENIISENDSLSQISFERKRNFLNEKNKEILITALEEIKEEFNTIPKKERPRSMIQPKTLKISKIEQLKQNQKQNFDRIKRLEEIKVKNALNETTHVTRSIKSARRNRELKSLNSSLKKPIKYTASEEEIVQKLNNYQEKIEKSKALHEKQINIKKENVKSQNSINKLEKNSFNQDDIIFKIIERTKAVSERKKIKLIKEKEKWEKIKTMNEQISNRLKELEKEFHRNLSEKEATLEKKMSLAEKIIKNRNASIGKDIEIKIELQKLRDEEAFIKLKRAQKIL